jgi:DNA helicase-2/ATP-dependent DNA helicase PcrA
VETDGMRVYTKPGVLMEWIVKTKQRTGHPQEHPMNGDAAVQREHEAVYFAYQELLEMQGLWDYEDLIHETVELFKNSSQVRRQFQERYLYIFVDEYQDINRGQYQIIQSIAPQGKDICVIGDPDQSIYAFRGSDVRYFHCFQRDYPLARSVHFSDNYRSTQIILDAAQQMMHPKKHQMVYEKLCSARKGENKLHIVECADEKHEAVMIGQKIEKMVGGIGFHSYDFRKIDAGEHKRDRTFSDFAVLYRTAKQGKVLAETFMKAGIPYQVASKAEIFFDPGIQALISYLKILESKGSYVDFEKINRSFGLGIGKNTMEIWKKWAFANRYDLTKAMENIQKFPVSEMRRDQQLLFDGFARKLTTMKNESRSFSVKEKIEYIRSRSQLKKKINPDQSAEDPVDEFIHSTDGYGNHINRFFKELSLQVDTDVYQPESEKVALMTMHASKGLEFPVVFIAGCEDGFIPHRRTNSGESEEDEERRLFYVAMTRAEDALFLSFSKKRNIYGKREDRRPSPFLADIGNRLITFEKIDAGKIKKKKQRQLNLF